MNLRIRELEAQCWTQRLTEHGPPWFDAEKFAELIVRECASIIESQDVDPAFRHRMAWAVKQRFGVE